MRIKKYGLPAALALSLIAVLTPADAWATTIPIQTTFTLSYNGTSPPNGTFNLYTGTSLANLVLTQSGTLPQVLPGAMNVSLVSDIGPVSTAACWISIAGDMGSPTSVMIPVFAFPANTSTNGLALPGSAPIVPTGMTDGTFTLSYTGELIAFDSPQIVGSFTLTEKPVVAPEPSSLLLLGAGLAVLAGTRRKLLAL